MGAVGESESFGDFQNFGGGTGFNFQRHSLVGVVGFEPYITGVRVLCLNAFRERSLDR